MPVTMTPAVNQQGFTLIEVLVAILVLSVGLLGLAALQGISLSDNNSAYVRSQAQYYAMDILERMRVNRVQALAGDYDIALGAAVPGATPEPAQTDLQGWLNAITGVNEAKAAIPNAQAYVATAGGAEIIVTVTITWSARGGRDAFVMESQL